MRGAVEVIAMRAATPGVEENRPADPLSHWILFLMSATSHYWRRPKTNRTGRRTEVRRSQSSPVNFGSMAVREARLLTHSQATVGGPLRRFSRSPRWRCLGGVQTAPGRELAVSL